MYFLRIRGERIRRVISNRFGISFVGDRNVFKLDVDMVVFCMLKLVNFMLCELYLSKTGIKKKEEEGFIYMYIFPNNDSGGKHIFKPQHKREMTRQ